MKGTDRRAVHEALNVADAGLLTVAIVHRRKGRSGEEMDFIVLSDDHGAVEAKARPETAKLCRNGAFAGVFGEDLRAAFRNRGLS